MQVNTNKIFCLSIFMIFLLVSCTDKEGAYCNTSETENSAPCYVYKEGELIELYTYKNDTMSRDGSAYQFDSNDDTLIRAFYRGNKRVRSYYEYYAANKIKSYVYFDFNSDTLYYREYNIHGKIIKELGDLFHEDGYTGVSTLDLNTDSIVEVISTVIAPPKTKFKVSSFVTLDTDLSSDTIRPIQQGYMPEEDNGIYSIRIKLKSQGSYRIYVDTELEDPDKGKTWRKTEGYKFSFPSKKKQSEAGD